MLRRSYDEEMEFQNKLNFAKHKTNAKKKLQAVSNASQSVVTEVPKQLQTQYNLSNIGHQSAYH